MNTTLSTHPSEITSHTSPVFPHLHTPGWLFSRLRHLIMPESNQQLYIRVPEKFADNAKDALLQYGYNILVGPEPKNRSASLFG